MFKYPALEEYFVLKNAVTKGLYMGNTSNLYNKYNCVLLCHLLVLWQHFFVDWGLQRFPLPHRLKSFKSILL